MHTDSTLQPIYDDQWYIHPATGTKYPPGYPRDLIQGLSPVTLTPEPTGNVVVSGFTINDDYEQVWQYRDKTPEEIQAELIPHLSAYRYQREIGGFTFNGLFIPTDEKTERRIVGARVKAEADPDYVIPDWTTDQGATVHTLDAATIIAISDAFDAHVQKCFSAMVIVRANIAEYTTRAEIEAAFEVAYGS